MDNREEILDALNDFSRKQSKEIPPLLEQFLQQVAKTGETLFPWTLLKALFVTKLEQVMNEFNEECINDEVPTCPNVENARFEVYRERIMEAVHRFHGAPFTIQRLCELLTDPKRHYKRCDKFMRGLEKNVLVVSTVDPFGRKVVSESKNLVNGMDTNNSSSTSSEDPATPATSSGLTSTTPPVPAWPSPSSSSSPTTTWPVQADLITPSTAPLLEVCDLPDPKEPPSIAASAAPTASSEPRPVNGHDAQSSGSSVTLSSNVSEVSSTPSTELSELASMEETVDSSDQQVAAEEMVGVEEEAATSTAISQEAAGVVEETVVETPPVAAEVMKETSDLADSSAEVTPAASGDWLANITDKPANAKTDSQEEPSAESQNCTSAESSEASPAADLQDKTVSDSQDRLSAESQDDAADQASSVKDESCVSVAGASDTEPSTETTPADTSFQADTDSSEAKAACGDGQGEEKRQEEEEKTNSGTTKMEESSTEAGRADDTVEVKSADTVPAETDCADSAITTPTPAPTSPTPSGPQEQVSCTSPVSSSETSTTPASSEVSTPQRASPSNSPSADAEPTDCSTSDAVESAVSATPAAASPTAPLPASAEEKCEDADTSSAVPMETDSASSSEDVSKAADEPDAAVSSSSSNSSSEKAEEAESPSTDTTSQADAMDQD